MTTTPCPACGHPTASRNVWRRMPTPRPARRRTADGRCTLCADHAPAAGRQTAAPVSREDVLTDWRWLHETGQLDPLDSLHKRCVQAAPRMGMTVAALEKALERAGIRSPAELSGNLGGGVPVYGGCQQCRSAGVRVTQAEDDVRALARRLSRRPDDAWLAELLETAKAELAREQAWRDSHLEWDHPDTEVSAA